jgi:sortase B
MGNKKRFIFFACLLVVFLGLGGYAAYQLYLSQAAYSQGDQAYEQIIQQVISEDVSQSSATDSQTQSVTDSTSEVSEQSNRSSGEVSQFDISDLVVDFATLKSINADSIGWLYCPNTVIDYPIMAADDYTYYLSHLPDGTENINGSLFLDYCCEPDFSGQISVIYGHSMKSGKMFGTLTNYKSQSYFEEHPYMYLYTENQNYRIALVYGAVVSANEWIDNGYSQDADGLLEYAKAHTTFVSSEEYSANQRFVVLSTCSYEYDDARYFVVGVLQPT